MTSKLKVVAPQAKTILSVEVADALKVAGEATYNSDQAVGLSKRANKHAALLLKKRKVHSDRLSSSYYKENPDDPIRLEVMMNLLAGKPADWAHYYHAFDNDKESLSKSIREKEVFVGYDKDGEELHKSEYDAASTSALRSYLNLVRLLALCEPLRVLPNPNKVLDANFTSLGFVLY
jgi:hypothetical protein